MINIVCITTLVSIGIAYLIGFGVCRWHLVVIDSNRKAELFLHSIADTVIGSRMENGPAMLTKAALVNWGRRGWVVIPLAAGTFYDVYSDYQGGEINWILGFALAFMGLMFGGYLIGTAWAGRKALEKLKLDEFSIKRVK